MFRHHSGIVGKHGIALLALFSGVCSGASLPTGFSESLVASGLQAITAMTFAPDGRLFICEQGGRVRVVKNGVLLAQPFATLPVDPEGERGLLGIAFDPSFASNGFVYLYHTTTLLPRRNRIVRVTAMGDVVVSGSDHVILELEPLNAIFHNGGAMHFGPDGKLYIAVGDNAVPTNAQSLGTRLGKMLRINRDGTAPADNPFFDVTTEPNRSIWALGVRNPFTFAFDPGSARMFINDVGNATWEEINEGIRAANYGWPETEGPETDPRFRSPLHAYGHGFGPDVGCAITGGAFYRPADQNFPSEFTGSYFFADFCSGWIRRYLPASKTVVSFASGIDSPVDLAVGPNGHLYYAARGSGSIHRIFSSATTAPQVTSQPATITVSAGQAAAFTVTASGSAPLRYQWYRNGVAISGATTATYQVASTSMSDHGARFHVVVTNDVGSTISNAALLTVTANQLPNAFINAPVAGALYIAGSTLAYSGDGSDPEDGALPISAFTWRIDFHHDTHFHPFMPNKSGVKSGSIVLPTSGETSANVWYRVHLTVKDSAGQARSIYRDVTPRKTNLTLDTNPRGLQVVLNGQPGTSPRTVQAVVGMRLAIGVPSPQTLAGVSYEFASWSDGGVREHTITVPGTATSSYVATFRQAVPASSNIPFLSDRLWSSVTNGWGPVERDKSNGETAALDGKVITLDNVPYAKGLGVHAPSSMTYALGGQCVAFRSDIGIDDETGGRGSVVFQVFADGLKLFDSGVMTSVTPHRRIFVDLTGRNQLTLVVTDGGDGVNYDHADWANARVSCGATTFLSARTWTSMSNGWGPAELNRSNGYGPAGDGRAITIDGQVFASGIGAHANSEIRYALNGACTNLSGRVGVDDEVGDRGSVIFQVLVDGAKLFDSGLRTGAVSALAFSVDLIGRSELLLRVSNGGDGSNYDHADWADAKLTCKVP